MSTMKYFNSGKAYVWNRNGITLDTIFSIHKNPKKREVVLYDDCDVHFHKEMSPEDCIEMLNEAIDWVRSEYDIKG